MKTEKPAQLEKIGLAQEVKRALEAAPSGQALAAAKEKLALLSKQREEAAAVVKQLRNAAVQELTDSARALLGTGKFLGPLPSKELDGALTQVEVLDRAAAMQSREVSNLVAAVSREANARLRPVFQGLVTRTASALNELRGVAAEHARILSAAAELGISQGEISNPVFAPVTTEMALDAAWFEARRDEGYTV